MKHIIAIANQKGGVGKTTTAVNLSASIAAMEKHVLLIDCDPQANASSGLNIDRSERENNIYDILFQPEMSSTVVRHTDLKYLDIIPSVQDLVAAEIELVEKKDREYHFKKIIDNIQTAYDYIILDCPPSLGLITINALCAASDLLIPLQCEYYALEGIASLMQTYELVKTRLNPDLQLMGVLLTMFDKRNKLSYQVETEVRNYFQERVFESIIPRNVRLSEAPSHGLPVLCYDYRSSGSQSYLAMGREIVAMGKKNEVVGS
jgi:chromosome partitioning protein